MRNAGGEADGMTGQSRAMLRVSRQRPEAANPTVDLWLFSMLITTTRKKIIAQYAGDLSVSKASFLLAENVVPELTCKLDIMKAGMFSFSYLLSHLISFDRICLAEFGQ